MQLKKLISGVNSWKEFKKALAPLSKLDKGRAFEEITKYYLLSKASYKDSLNKVWLQREIPTAVFKKLNLPANDQGIDLIAETKDGLYWAIQCKYLQEEDSRLSHRAISTFTSLSRGIAKNISYCLVATTADDYAKLYKGIRNIGFINADEWNRLGKEDFDNFRAILAGREVKYNPYKPKKHQQKAINEAKNHFLKAKNNRGKLVFPCGAGKSLTGYWLKQELKAKSTIVAVPSLSLVKQTLEVYLRESVANRDKIEWLCVCSDEGIGNNDDVVVHTNEIGVPCVTDVKYIANWLKLHKNKKTVIFTTYQSGRTIAQASKMAKASFDLGIMDEAHKTVGSQDKLFSYLLFDKNIRIQRRIFMTATERRYAGSSDNILSMDDAEVYGETFTQMPFKEAISEGILSDYKIITLFISDKEVKELIEKNAYVKPEGREWDKETEARTLASLIALRKAMRQFPIHHAVTFHSSIKKAEAFNQSQELFSLAFPQFKNVDSFHVSGAMPTSKRSKIVNEFAASKKAIITNAKCLTEGVDVPNIDCVLFADPRKSTVDIVQAVGRALRKKEGKKFGYVILPVFTKSKTKVEIIESAEFKEVLSTLRALASNDERIIEFFRDISKNKKPKSPKGGLVQFDIDVNITDVIKEKDLIESLELKTWDKLAKLSWMPFEEAREFVRKLKLKSTEDWFRYARSGEKPLDLPSFPNELYKHEWSGYGDFLGTGTIATQNRVYLDFYKAREIIRSKKIKSTTQWKVFSKSSEMPKDIPLAPDQIYNRKGWNGWPDFLGNGNVTRIDNSKASFLKVRNISRSLELKNLKEWNAHWKSNKRDYFIPSNPQITFKKYWKGWGDFLGTGNESQRYKKYVSFPQAKKFALKLKLNSMSEWKQYLLMNKIPNGIPKSPDGVYQEKGWISWGDFLGTGIVAPHLKTYREFSKAREFVRKLGLKSINEWNQYCKKGGKPDDIPNAPHLSKQYRKEGWISWGDFLGTGNIASFNRTYMSFQEARKYVHSLGLKSFADWGRYCKSGNKHPEIPYHPERSYKKDWVSFEDFLGVNYKVNFVSYEEARKYARKLKVNTMGWRHHVSSGKKPKDIPSNPDKTYKNNGWKGWADFLGKEV